MKIAQNAETAVEEAPLLSQGTRESPTQINHIHPSQELQVKPLSCYRCGGRDGHAPDECGAIKSRFKKWKKSLMKVRSLNSKPGTDWPENSLDDESEEPVLSPSGDRSITED